MKQRHVQWKTLAWTILLPLVVGGLIGSLFTTPAIDGWYALLEKPSFNPPNWVFGPVWTVLYIMMGAALYLVMTAKSKLSKKPALYVFIGQLVLNLGWSIIFFGLHMPLLGLIEIVLLIIAVLYTIVTFAPHSKTAAWLLAPYVAWLLFATSLNTGIVLLN